MIVRFLKPSATFGGVFYNTDKVNTGEAELMAAANFGLLDSLDEVRPMDYRNYLKTVSALNKQVSKPQLHVALSTSGESHNKHELTAIAKLWLEKMGYARQPYLIFYHQDTDNNHVHIVSTRITHEGRKISSAFEWVRAIRAINQIIGVDQSRAVQNDIEKAKSYRFSTIAQFKLILEKLDYTIKDNHLLKSGIVQTDLDFDKVPFQQTDLRRAAQLTAIFKKYAPRLSTTELVEFLKMKMGVELIFHSKDGKPAYGYTVLDHAQKNAYKGGEIMPLKELMNANEIQEQTIGASRTATIKVDRSIAIEPDTPIRINIASDIDDEAINGPRRHRKKKARTNLR